MLENALKDLSGKSLSRDRRRQVLPCPPGDSARRFARAFMQEHAMIKKKLPSPRRERRLRSAHEAVETVFSTLGGKERRHLTALWQNWELVLGGELAALGRPLGHKEHVLTIGADDNMAMQELALQSEEILQRANAFMDSEYFRKVQVVLTQGRTDLARTRPRRPDSPMPAALPPPPAGLGALEHSLDPLSPVTRCYKAYLALFRKK